MSYREGPSKLLITAVIAGSLLLVSGIFVGSCYVYPKYRVWQQRLEGEAELARAQQNRQISIQEAEAKKEASKALAEAEVERAKGVAQANHIIADSLQGHEEYLRYLWIDKLSEGSQREVIYVPTEASLPILEATRSKAAPEVTK